MINHLLNKLCSFIEEKSSTISLTELIAFSITRPFNMKGQEFENKISYMLQSAIKGCKDIKEEFPECFVKTYNNKSAKDLLLSYKYKTNLLTEVPFSVKNYTIDRFQLSTFAKKLDFFEETYVENLKLNIGDFLSESQVYSFKQDILNKFDSGVTLFGLSSVKTNDLFRIENFNSKDDLAALVKEIESDFLVVLDKEDYLSSLNTFCAEGDFGLLQEEEEENADICFLKNKDFLCKKYKKYITKSKSVNENLKADIFLKTLNKNSFLDGIDKIQLHKTKGTTSHFKFLMFNSAVDKEYPIMTFDLGTNPLNRGLWFCHGKRFFYNKNLELNKMFNGILEKKDVDLKPWLSISEEEKVENELNFLSRKKTSFHLAGLSEASGCEIKIPQKLTR